MFVNCDIDELKEFFNHLDCAFEEISIQESIEDKKAIAYESIGKIELVFCFGWISTENYIKLLSLFSIYTD